MTGRADGFRELLDVDGTPACAVVVQAVFAGGDVVGFPCDSARQAVGFAFCAVKRGGQYRRFVLHRHALACQMSGVFGFQFAQLHLQSVTLVTCLRRKRIVGQFDDFTLQTLALGLQTVAFHVCGGKIEGFQFAYHAAALVHADGQRVEVGVHVLALLGQHGLKFVHRPPSDFLVKLRELRRRGKQLPVLRQTADFGKQRAAVLPVHFARHRPDVGQQLEAGFVDQLRDPALVLVFRKRHIVDVVVARIAGVALDGRTARLLPLLTQHLAQLDRLAVHDKNRGDFGHRACRSTVRLDVRPRVAGAVLVEQQPRQAVINTGLACGVLAVDVVHALVEVEVQL